MMRMPATLGSYRHLDRDLFVQARRRHVRRENKRAGRVKIRADLLPGAAALWFRQ